MILKATFIIWFALKIIDILKIVLKNYDLKNVKNICFQITGKELLF
jgi:hypothetical protein